MTDSSGDSDCFESADEGFDNDSIAKIGNIKSKSIQKEADLPGLLNSTSCVVSSTNGEKEYPQSNPTASSLQYRKRPERGKNASKPVQAVFLSNRKTSLNEQTSKTNIMKPDALIQDITSHLSKNLNKGFSTIQQTSNSIKDLVISSLPAANLKENYTKFSYDDEEEISSQMLDLDDTKEFLESQQSKESEKDTSTDVELVSSNVKEFKKETLKSDLSNEISSMEISESLEDKSNQDQYVFQEKLDNSNNNILIQGSGDGICNKIHDSPLNLEKQDEIYEETRDFNDDSIEGNLHKNAKQSLIDVEEESKRKSDDYQEENVHEPSAPTLDEEKNLGADFIEKDNWDSSELELEGLNEIEEGSPIGDVESEIKEELKPEVKEIKQNIQNEMLDENEGWDDFDFEEELEVLKNGKAAETPSLPSEDARNFKKLVKQEGNQTFVQQGSNRDEKNNADIENNWSWDNFGEKQETKQNSGWNLGSWGVNALLNTATSVTQGLTNVIEAGLGVPDPEALARMEYEATNNSNEGIKVENIQQKESSQAKSDDNANTGLNLFPDFGITNLVAGVTKNIVENAKVQEIGSKVIAGGLDTLESFGKKTMEVLQEGDPGLKKKRALLLGSNKPVLSQVLREAKAKTEMADRRIEEKQLAKMCHFETLFDDYQGLMHLEALEMLSRQCELKLEQMKAGLSTSESDDLIETLNEVKELCVIDEDEFKANYSRVFDFKISLLKATEPLKNEISVQKIVQVYESWNTWLKFEENRYCSAKDLFQKTMSTLAELTATAVALFHKGGELLSVKTHRKTVEEAEALLQMTGYLCCEIDNISQKFLKFHTSRLTEYDQKIAVKIEEEAINAKSYIKDAFTLLIPVLQLGAAL